MENEEFLGDKLKEDVKVEARLGTQNLEEERNKIVAELELRKAIDTNPKETKELKKRLADIEVELAEIYSQDGNKQKTEEDKEQDEDVLDDEKKATEEKEELIEEETERELDDGDESIVPPSDEEKLPEEESKEIGEENEETLKQAYYNALITLYNKKKETIRKQIAAGELVSSQEDYNEEIRLETALYAARDKYMLLEKEDPYTEKRTELIKSDKDAREPIEMELRNRAKEYREIEDKLRQLNEEEQDLNARILNPDITPAEIENIQMRLERIGSEKRDLEVERAKILPGLQKAVEIRQQRTLERSGLEKKYVETLSGEDIHNYKYQQNKIDVMNNNVEQANNQNYQNIKNRIDERERKIKEISKELRELSDSTDFERRLFLLDQLDRENNMLEADIQAKSDLDRGISLTETEGAIEADDKFKGENERQEDFVQATQEVRDAIEEVQDMEEDINPSILGDDTSIQSERDEERLEAFATAAIVSDTPEEMVGTYIGGRVVQKVTEETEPFRSNLQKQVVDIEDPNEAKKYVEVTEKADKKLDKVTEKVQEQI